MACGTFLNTNTIGIIAKTYAINAGYNLRARRFQNPRVRPPRSCVAMTCQRTEYQHAGNKKEKIHAHASDAMDAAGEVKPV